MLRLAALRQKRTSVAGAQACKPYCRKILGVLGQTQQHLAPWQPPMAPIVSKSLRDMRRCSSRPGRKPPTILGVRHFARARPALPPRRQDAAKLTYPGSVCNATGSCWDTDLTWRDKYGNSCPDYSALAYCTQDLSSASPAPGCSHPGRIWPSNPCHIWPNLGGRSWSNSGQVCGTKTSTAACLLAPSRRV